MRMNRTTIVAENALVFELRALAQKRGVSFSEIVRCALAEYVVKNTPQKRRLSFVGAGASGGKLRISERAEDLLFGRPKRAKP